MITTVPWVASISLPLGIVVPGSSGTNTVEPAGLNVTGPVTGPACTLWPSAGPSPPPVEPPTPVEPVTPAAPVAPPLPPESPGAPDSVGPLGPVGPVGPVEPWPGPS